MRRPLTGVVAILVVLAGLGLADRDASPRRSGGRPVSASVMPVTFPTGSLRSTWFCAGGTASADGPADHRVVIANPTARARTATVTVFPAALDGDPNAEQVRAMPPTVTTLPVPARSRAQLRVGDVLAAPFAAALVEVDGGDVAVEHTVGPGPTPSTAPCASAAASNWQFAAGSTAQGAQELLALFNPFPDNAVVDISMATTDGFREPQEYDGFVVPGEQLVVIDLGVAIARHDLVSTSVVSRTGRLVVDRLQLFDGTTGPKTAIVSLGAPLLREAWAFPDGQIGEGLAESFVVYNPSDRGAEVDLDIALDEPDVNGQVDPVAVSVSARSAVTVRLNDEQRVPAGVAHTTTVKSVNGTPVVAERLVTSTAPAPRSGVSFTLGSPLAATGWLFSVGAASAEVAEVVVLVNPSSDTIARVSFRYLAQGRAVEIDGLQDVEVPPVGRLTVDLGQHVNRNDLSLVLTASEPVVAERGMYAASGTGFTQSTGTPRAGTTVTLSAS